jgi:hypothetical protein
MKDFLAILSAATPKSLSEAKLLLGQAASHFTTFLAEFDAKVAAHAADLQALSEARASLATMQVDLASANGRVTELTSELAAVHTGALSALASAGIAAEKFDADSIKAAASKRAEALGHELLAARGLKPLPEAINATAEATGSKVDISSPEKLLAHYESLAIGTTERADFFKANEQAIWAAWSKSK